VQRWEEILKVNDGGIYDFMLFIPSGTLIILPKPAFRKNLLSGKRGLPFRPIEFPEWLQEFNIAGSCFKFLFLSL
jgi:hypothetical protein